MRDVADEVVDKIKAYIRAENPEMAIKWVRLLRELLKVTYD